MALAIAGWCSATTRLYIAIVLAGIVIALTGGSRFNISGPTAAFVVILYPLPNNLDSVVCSWQRYFRGLFLVIMALSRLGRLIEYIPLPLHWALPGIGITIGTLQIKDF